MRYSVSRNIPCAVCQTPHYAATSVAYALRGLTASVCAVPLCLHFLFLVYVLAASSPSVAAIRPFDAARVYRLYGAHNARRMERRLRDKPVSRAIFNGSYRVWTLCCMSLCTDAIFLICVLERVICSPCM
ncbi:hypothetical protein TRVL_03660 [Trypanosoma vivax]|nr:hypothetical protein TRVL_03660 [Trypanosoma vivax]